MATKSAITVTVYCNLPNGLQFTLPDGRVLSFTGYPVSRMVSADGAPLPAGQYGVTDNVSTDDWAYIEKTYGGCAFITGKLLFAEAKPASGTAHARELAGTRHGMEQANVWNRGADRRLPQGAGKTQPETRRES